MKKLTAIIVCLFCFWLVAPAQVTSFDHDKYWFYRWRLTHLFLKEGKTDYNCQVPYNLVSGYSIPAGGLEQTANHSSPQEVLDGKGAVGWGDGTTSLGWYIGVLATEWKLLKNQGQSTSDVEQELFFAMKAFERVDKNAGILFSPNQAQNCTGPDGFFGRDDVTKPFIQQYFPNADIAASSSEYIGENTDPITGLYSPMVNRFQPGSDEHPYNSVDQVSSLMMGFALVVKCLDNNTNYNGYNFKANSKYYTTLMINYLKNNNYAIKEPITGQTVTYGGIEAQVDAYPLAKAAEKIVNESWGSNTFTGQFDNVATNVASTIWQGRQTLLNDLFIENEPQYTLGFRHELAAIGHSWQVGFVPTKCYTLRPCIIPWLNWGCVDIDFWRYQFNVDPTGITSLVQIFAPFTNLICTPIKPPPIVINTTDFTLGRQGGMFKTELFAMMHQYLNGGGNSIPTSFYQNAISSAPCVGPHYFKDNPNFQSYPGWQGSARWTKRKSAFADPDYKEGAQVFNGLDFMLLYNIWSLMNPQQIGAVYHDELNPILNFSGNATGTYYGFESMRITGTVTSSAGVTFTSPSITLGPGTSINGNVSLSAPTNGVSLQCQAGGQSFARTASVNQDYKEVTAADIATYNKEYTEYIKSQIEPQLQKVSDELGTYKYVAIQEYVEKAANNAPTENKSDSVDGDVDDFAIELYPNPSSGLLTVSSVKPITEVILQTVLGQIVATKKADAIAYTLTLDLSDLPMETYICVIRMEDAVAVKKWIKN